MKFSPRKSRAEEMVESDSLIPGSWVWDIESGDLKIHPRAIELFKCSNSLFENMESIKRLMTSYERDLFESNINDVLSGIKEFADFEHRIHGNPFSTVQQRIYCIRDGKKKPVHLHSIVSEASAGITLRSTKSAIGQIAEMAGLSFLLAKNESGRFRIDLACQFPSDFQQGRFLDEVIGAAEFEKCYFSLCQGNSYRWKEFDFFAALDECGSVQLISAQPVSSSSVSQYSKEEISGLSRTVAVGKSSFKVFHSVNNAFAILYGKLEQCVRRIDRNQFSVENARTDFEKMIGLIDRAAKDIHGVQVLRSSGNVDLLTFDSLFVDLESHLDERLVGCLDIEPSQESFRANRNEVVTALTLLLDEVWRAEPKPEKITVRFPEKDRLRLLVDGPKRLSPLYFLMVSRLFKEAGLELSIADEGYTVEELPKAA